MEEKRFSFLFSIAQQVLVCLLPLILFCACQQSSANSLVYDKVLIVDSVTFSSGATNYLVRSPKPVHNRTFQYSTVVSMVQNRTVTDSLPLLEPPVYIVDINLLNECLGDDRHDIEREQGFFQNHSMLGTFVSWPLMGTHIDPRMLAPATVRDVLRFYAEQPDQLLTRVPTLRQMLNTEHPSSNATTPISTIILTHCQSGLDRTGELMAAYVMQYRNFSFPQAVEWDNAIAGGVKSMHQRDENVAAWHCFYLETVVGMPNLDCNGTIIPPQ